MIKSKQSNFSFTLYVIDEPIAFNASAQEIWNVLLKPSLFSFLYGFILVFGISFNLVIIIIYTFKKSFKNTKYFFVNLSVSDIMILTVCIPRAICDLFSDEEWQFGYFYCKVYYFLENGLVFISSLTIMAISLERYCVISNPLKAKSLLNKKKLLNSIILIWGLGISMSMPFIWMTNYSESTNQCDLSINLGYLFYVISLNVVFVFFPMFFLLYLYICIIIKTKKNYYTFIKVFSLIKNNTYKRRPQASDVSCESLSNSYAIRKVSSLKRIFSSEPTSTHKETAVNINYNTNTPNNNFLHENYNCKTTPTASNYNLSAKRLSKSTEDLFNSTRISRNHKSSSTSSLASMDFLIRLKAKQKFKTTVKISTLTIISFWFQVPIRLFVCWSYVNTYFAKFNIDYFENFIGKNYNQINLFYNLATLVYFLHFVSNSVIYNIFSVQFRKAFKSFWVFKKY